MEPRPHLPVITLLLTPPAMTESCRRWTTMVLLLLFLQGIAVALSVDTCGHSDYPYAPSVGGPPPPSHVVVDAAASADASAPQVVVAADGTGNYTTISDAVAAAPSGSAERFVIRIKAGVYRENVVVPEKKRNITFVGDGMGQTLLTSNRSSHGGWDIEHSATLVVLGAGFLAHDMNIENSAGPGSDRAVALRSKSDQSAFYRCAIKGYQDTLYVEEGRQFFRECSIYGTIDFIFGHASAVLQSCHLYARRPLSGQEIIFTAQGRDDKSIVSGIVIHDCVVAAAEDLKPVEASIQGFLGRPWKQYSTTVVMKSYLGGIIDPAGWMAWNGTSGLDTVNYREYENRGPGADTSRRVTWPGFRVLTDPAEAGHFTVSSFIQGDEWLPSTGVPYGGGL